MLFYPADMEIILWFDLDQSLIFCVVKSHLMFIIHCIVKCKQTVSSPEYLPSVTSNYHQHRAECEFIRSSHL